MKLQRRRARRAPSAKRLLSPKQASRVSSAELDRTRGRINRSLARGDLRFYVAEAFAPILASEARKRGWTVRIQGVKHTPDEKVLVFSLAPPTKRAKGVSVGKGVTFTGKTLKLAGRKRALKRASTKLLAEE